MKIIHDLSKLSNEEIEQYKREVSQFIGLDPDLNGLDTIWLVNEGGPGQSLVLYARRGTAEILREINGIQVSSLTHVITPEAVVFTAVGVNKDKRQEIAVGSKSLRGLSGKAYDNAIMTSSTRALRRLTMQFTKLGILDESEIEGLKSDPAVPNPAAGATLSGPSPIFTAFPTVQPNNAPGKDITAEAEKIVADVTKTNVNQFLKHLSPEEKTNFAEHQKKINDEAQADLNKRAEKLKAELTDLQKTVGMPVSAKQTAGTAGPTFAEHQKKIQDDAKVFLEKEAAKQAAELAEAQAVSPVTAPVTEEKEPAKEAAKPRRARRPKNTVSLDGPEPEVVNKTPQPVQTVIPPGHIDAQGTITAAPEGLNLPARPNPSPGLLNGGVGGGLSDGLKTEYVAPTSAPGPANPAPVNAPPSPQTFEGKPSDEQMAEYRKKVSKYTAELPSSEGLGSVQKMRAFITRMSGNTPQMMSVTEWEEMISWLDSFVATNSMKALVKYINDLLGVK